MAVTLLSYVHCSSWMGIPAYCSYLYTLLCKLHMEVFNVMVKKTIIIVKRIDQMISWQLERMGNV